MPRARLDHAAGATQLEEVAAALAGLPDGNPSSPHAEGRAARAALDSARDRAAAALGIQASEVIFTASGTEAVSLALLGAGRRLRRGARVVTWAAEHQAVLASVRRLQVEGAEVELLEVDAEGVCRVEALATGTALVSAALANNEVGSLQPVEEIAAAAGTAGAILHLDCCQGPQWVEPPLAGVHLASFSGHKLGAGSGGLLVVRPGVRLDPLFQGGPQERGLRPGWEDVRSATAVAVALETCSQRRREWSAKAAVTAALLQGALNGAGGRLTGSRNRLPNHASAVFPGLRGEDLILALDLAGVAASSGSVCASGSLDPSHVLLAMGLSLDDSLAALRLTTGPATTVAEVNRGVEALATVVAGLVRPAAGARPA